MYPVHLPDGNQVFREYYQISGDDKPDDTAESEPQDEGELMSHYESSHSLFGFIWQISAATGWSVNYILWDVNLQTLQMMLYDAPHYVTSKPKGDKPGNKKKDKTPEPASGRKKSRIAELFQSRLNTPT